MIRVTRRALAAFAPYRRPGYLEAVEAAALRTDDDAVWLDEEGYEALRLKFRLCGPGCHLARLLAWFGIRDDGKCGCHEFSAQMDAWGPDGCAEREDEILGHLAVASVKRGLPFVPPAARLLIRQAIANARHEATPAPGDDRPA